MKSVKVIEILLFGLIAHFGCGAVSAADAESVPPEVELAKIGQYAFGGVGFAGTTSKGETLYVRILGEEGAEAKFVEVFEKGTPEAKAYALSGLQKLGSDQYEKLKAQFLKENPQVNSMTGCVISKATAAAAVARFEKKNAVK